MPTLFQPVRLRIAFPVLIAAILAACSGKTDAPRAAAPLPVSALKVAPRPVPILIDVVGRTEGSKEVEIRSRVTGIVQKQLFQEGEPVKAGASLFLIERAPFENALAQAHATLNQDRARLEQTQRESARLQPLLAKRAISQREAEDSVTSQRQAEAALQASEARVRDAELNLSYTAVPSPISGITNRAQRSEGSLVTAGTESSLLTTLTQTDPLWVRFSLSESELAMLRGNAGKRAEVRILESDDREYSQKGRLNFAGSIVDARLGTVQLRAEFANPDLTLLPGQFVRTRLIAGSKEAITVPQSAVLQNDQGRYVWTIGPENKAVQRKVEAGAWVGRDWVITSGLKPGDQVIIDNLIRIRSGTVVSADSPPAPAITPAQPAKQG